MRNTDWLLWAAAIVLTIVSIRWLFASEEAVLALGIGFSLGFVVGALVFRKNPGRAIQAE